MAFADLRAASLPWPSLTFGLPPFAPSPSLLSSQAQQKLHASKWADGAPLPQVAKRVAELARDESATTSAISACRKAVHALKTAGGGLGGLPGADELDDSASAAEKRAYALETAQALCKEAATMSRASRETPKLIESLSLLGSLMHAEGKGGRAAEAWTMALDALFNTQDVCRFWQPLFAKDAPMTVSDERCD